jgi:hypothetical protein
VTKATARPVAVLTVLATLSFLVAACGGRSVHGVASLASSKSATTEAGASSASSPSGESGPMKAELLKYAECMRSQGIPDFPDPVRSPLGGYAYHVRISPGSDLDPNSPRNKSAQKVCQKDVPSSIADVTPAEMAAQGLEWSRCMQAHGEPNFPDPNGQGVIKVANATGTMDPNSPQFQRAEKACQSLGNGEFVVQWPSSSGGPSSGG